eukprot:TRINITY_DN9216_c0_g1_i3.p1 TRINITY_DN9216_c0_g1~~TRINITY_DN9216_c0_g1_i3.p1  ORF type:complete len:502 (+),score=50.08 TRINITY_DN9216_c0_g1_i3:80-1585(+)
MEQNHTVKHTFVHVDAADPDGAEISRKSRPRASSAPAPVIRHARALGHHACATEDETDEERVFQVHALAELCFLPQDPEDYASMHSHPGPYAEEVLGDRMSETGVAEDFTHSALSVALPNDGTNADRVDVGPAFGNKFSDDTQDYNASSPVPYDHLYCRDQRGIQEHHGENPQGICWPRPKCQANAQIYSDPDRSARRRPCLSTAPMSYPQQCTPFQSQLGNTMMRARLDQSSDGMFLQSHSDTWENGVDGLRDNIAPVHPHLIHEHLGNALNQPRQGQGFGRTDLGAILDPGASLAERDLGILRPAVCFSTSPSPPCEQQKNWSTRSHLSKPPGVFFCKEGSDEAFVAGNRTTVMLMNVPLGYTTSKLMRTIDSEGFAGMYDFIYVPMDFAARGSSGFAFVNLVDPLVAQRFVAAFNAFSRWLTRSKNVCRAVWAKHHQGLRANVARYRNSSVMGDGVPYDYKPRIFKNGREIPFPPPDRTPPTPVVRAKRPQNTKVHHL